MKVRVQYTYEIDGENLAALKRYHKPGELTRDDLRQLLKDLGQMGVDEQISQGRIWLQPEVQD